MQRRFQILAGVSLLVALVWGVWPSSPPQSSTPDVALTDPPEPDAPARPVRTPAWAPEPIAAEDTGVRVEPVEPPEPVAEDTGSPEPEVVEISAQILESDGRPVEGVLASEDCGVLSWSGPDGWASVEVPAYSVCRFQGRRPDGVLWGRSAWLTVEADPFDQIALELIVPEEQTGGLGVMIQEHELGVVVRDVRPDTPAAEMGLRPGDVIIEVDGLPAATLTLNDFVEVMTGPVGSEVTFVLADLGADTGMMESVMRLERAWLQP